MFDIFRLYIISIYLAVEAVCALRCCTITCDNSSRFLLPRKWVPKRFLRNFNARLSFEIRNNSIARRSYGAKPTISRTTPRMNLLCLVNFYEVSEWGKKILISIQKQTKKQYLHPFSMMDDFDNYFWSLYDLYLGQSLFHNVMEPFFYIK